MAYLSNVFMGVNPLSICYEHGFGDFQPLKFQSLKYTNKKQNVCFINVSFTGCISTMV